ncbi:hypothetical protein TWF718_003377 [Orbilia javanica]|uniref:Uncharacterized protein n=1 Tax=Orbilia javanica TaxID=47235 RepID=A0AAN8MP75_9PEZI
MEAIDGLQASRTELQYQPLTPKLSSDPTEGFGFRCQESPRRGAVDIQRRRISFNIVIRSRPAEETVIADLPSHQREHAAVQAKEPVSTGLMIAIICALGIAFILKVAAWVLSDRISKNSRQLSEEQKKRKTLIASMECSQDAQEKKQKKAERDADRKERAEAKLKAEAAHREQLSVIREETSRISQRHEDFMREMKRDLALKIEKDISSAFSAVVESIDKGNEATLQSISDLAAKLNPPEPSRISTSLQAEDLQEGSQ